MRVLALIAALLFTTSLAKANGRFPEAQAIESAGDMVVLRATFGILVSHDRGTHWRWICERALGYDGVWDPPIALTSDGRLWVGLEDGLVSTETDGCELEPAAELDGHLVKDLTTDGETVWAITGAPGKRGFVWRRLANKKFERLGAFDETNLMTIEVAPSKSPRVYVSGQPYSTIRGGIYRSDDGAKTFSHFTNELAAEGPFFIGAVDPIDPDRLLVRHLHAKGSDLLLSKDGGKSFTNVLSMKSAMFGFAKSGSSVYWAGSGLPEDGLFRSEDRGDHFENIAHQGVLCLHAASESALFVCENALTPGAPAIALVEGKTLRPLARFSDIEGPIVCASPRSRAHLCEAAWPATKALLAPTSAPTPPSVPPPPPKKSCSCDAVGRPAPFPSGLAIVIAALLLRAFQASRVDRAAARPL